MRQLRLVLFVLQSPDDLLFAVRFMIAAQHRGRPTEPSMCQKCEIGELRRGGLRRAGCAITGAVAAKSASIGQGSRSEDGLIASFNARLRDPGQRRGPR